MAVRQVVKIDEELCNGCGECVPACAEGAIQIVDGVAKLVADNLCDGLGACLGDCPEGAITIEEREAEEFDEHAVKEHLDSMGQPHDSHEHKHDHGHGHDHHGKIHAGPPPDAPAPAACGCPSAKVMQFDAPPTAGPQAATGPQPSELRQWPIQLHLVPPTAPYFKGADVVLAADCVAFAVGDFHSAHLKGRSLAIACPKLDQGMEIYLQKLISMIDDAKINTLTVMVMEVPCCAGLVQLAKAASEQASRKVPVKQMVVGLHGDIQSEDWI